MQSRHLDYFAVLVADDSSLPLTEAALTLAQDVYPDLDLQGALSELDMLANRLRKRVPEGTPHTQKLQLLNRFFFGELGFGPNANDYYDPDNSYLNIVLKTRRGIPVSLALVFMELAQQIGLPVRGVSFPNHFLMRLSVASGEIILDPLTGKSLSREQLQALLDPWLENHGYSEPEAVALAPFLRVASGRQVLARMLGNLKAIYTQQSRWERLLAVQQRLVILLPDAPSERRDRGLAYANLECFRPALEDLHHYLQARPDAPDAAELRARLPELRRLSQNLN